VADVLTEISVEADVSTTTATKTQFGLEEAAADTPDIETDPDIPIESWPISDVAAALTIGARELDVIETDPTAEAPATPPISTDFPVLTSKTPAEPVEAAPETLTDVPMPTDMVPALDALETPVSAAEPSIENVNVPAAPVPATPVTFALTETEKFKFKLPRACVCRPVSPVVTEKSAVLSPTS